MEINVNQKKISVGDKYEIFTDGQPTHRASRALFQLLPEVRLFENSYGPAPRMIINKKLSLFKARYALTRWDNNVLAFRTRSFWKVYYQCDCGADVYDIYGHRGRKYSIYKNNIQVAWWDKKAVSWFAGDNYKIMVDHDADINLIISFCLIIDNFSNDDHDGDLFHYDFGNIGFQAKRFDSSWQPR